MILPVLALCLSLPPVPQDVAEADTTPTLAVEDWLVIEPLERRGRRPFAPDAVFNRETPDTAKGVVTHMRPPAASIDAAAETARPAWIVFPTFRAGARTALEPVPGPRAFMRLADESFNYGLHGGRGFAAMSRLLRGCMVRDMAFGDLESALAALDGLAREAPAEAAS